MEEAPPVACVSVASLRTCVKPAPQECPPRCRGESLERSNKRRYGRIKPLPSAAKGSNMESGRYKRVQNVALFTKRASELWERSRT